MSGWVALYTQPTEYTPMPFSVNAYADDHRLTVTTETAKEAFAKAVDWHVANGSPTSPLVMASKATRLPNFHR